MALTETFNYRVPWRSKSAHPGSHPSLHLGGEHEFYGHELLVRRPEAHNIDVHASLLDPFQQYVVRTFRQRGLINVCILADLSASMNFDRKRQLLADFTETTAYSVYRSGDHFSFIGAGERLHESFFYPPRWYKGGAPELVEQLRTIDADGRHCRALIDIAARLPQRRSLVFLVSDFHFPIDDISAIFDGLVKHDVVPVVLWQSSELAMLPDWGLINLYDAEQSRNRLLWMRPALKNKIGKQFEQRRRQLTKLFLRYGRQPLVLQDSINPDLITRYFHE